MLEIILFVTAVAIFMLLDMVKPSYGIVFHAASGEYVDTAYVVLRHADTGDEVMRQITDMYGRYYFFAPAGRYRITVERTHFSLAHPISPSTILYGAPYMGGVITRNEESVISVPIALHQDEYDWNHENKLKLGREVAGYNRYLRWIFLAVAFIHLCVSISFFLQGASLLLGVIAIMMMVWWGFFLYDHAPVLGHMKWKDGKHYGGYIEVIGYANILIRKVPLTAEGHYWSLIPPGVYTIVVHEYTSADQTESKVIATYHDVAVPRGILNKSLLLD